MSIIWLSLFVVASFMMLIIYKPTPLAYTDRPEGNHRRKRGAVYPFEVMAFLAILALALFCASRDLEQSYDTKVYFAYFDEIYQPPFFTIQGNYDIGFEFVAKLVSRISFGNFRIFLFILAFANVFCVYRGVAKCLAEEGTVALFLYLFMIGIHYNFVVLRSGLAISAILYALRTWETSKIKTIGWLVVAALFHQTAWVVLVACLIVQLVRLKKKALCLIMIAGLFVYVASVSSGSLQQLIEALYQYVPNSMVGRYELYFMGEIERNKISIFYLGYYALSLFLLFLLRKEIDDNKYINGMFEINASGLVILAIFSQFTVIVRIVDYFLLCSYVVLLPKTAKVIGATKGKWLAAGVCIFFLILYLRIYLQILNFKLL